MSSLFQHSLHHFQSCFKQASCAVLSSVSQEKLLAKISAGIMLREKQFLLTISRNPILYHLGPICAKLLAIIRQAALPRSGGCVGPVRSLRQANFSLIIQIIQSFSLDTLSLLLKYIWYFNSSLTRRNYFCWYGRVSKTLERKTSAIRC